MAIDCALYGVVARDAVARNSKNGKPYARFSVRVGDGDTAQFASVMYFGGDAADLADKLAKGAKVYVEGTIKLDEWTASDGAKRTGMNVTSFHARVPEIGRHKPKVEHRAGYGDPYARGPALPVQGDMNCDVPF